MLLHGSSVTDHLPLPMSWATGVLELETLLR